MHGKKNWFVVDGFRPPEKQGGANDYEGHECIMILNCNEKDANITIDVFFMDRDPVLGLKLTVKGQRISAFRSNDKGVFGDLELSVGLQYSLRISSDVDVIVQYGRMDINQSNLAYLATMGYGE